MKILNKIKNNKKGFTLVEIIVVVVILAVLLAIAVPSVLRYLDEADNAKYTSQARAALTTAQAEFVKAYSSDRKVTTTEVSSMVKEIRYEAGLASNVSVTLYTVAPKVTENDGTLTITNGTAFAGKDSILPTDTDIKAIAYTVSDKQIVAIGNDKIYVGDVPAGS